MTAPISLHIRWLISAFFLSDSKNQFLMPPLFLFFYETAEILPGATVSVPRQMVDDRTYFSAHSLGRFVALLRAVHR